MVLQLVKLKRDDPAHDHEWEDDAPKGWRSSSAIEEESSSEAEADPGSEPHLLAEHRLGTLNVKQAIGHPWQEYQVPMACFERSSGETRVKRLHRVLPHEVLEREVAPVIPLSLFVDLPLQGVQRDHAKLGD